MWSSLKRLASKKAAIGFCSVAVIAGGVYETQFKTVIQPLRYQLADVSRGTVVVSVKGTGQVTGLNQVDVKPLASGAVTKIRVKVGDSVKTGAPLVELDQKNAQKAIRDAGQSVRDANISLGSAALSLKKLKQPADAVALVQAQNTLNQAKRNLETVLAGADPLDIRQAENDLRTQQENAKLSSDGKTPQVVRNAYDSAVPTLKTLSQSVQEALFAADAVIGVDNTLANDSYEKVLSALDGTKLVMAQSEYPLAKAATASFKWQSDALLALNENPATIEAALSKAINVLNTMDPLLRDTYGVVQNTIPTPAYPQASLDTLRNAIQTQRSGLASKLASITSATQSIQQANVSYASALLNVQKAQLALDKMKQGPVAADVAAAQERVAEATQSLAKLQKGADAIDIQLSQNSVAQRAASLAIAQNTYADAVAALKDSTVLAPFDGVVAKVSVQLNDPASPSTAVVTLLTHTQLAQITLNEVDVAKVKVGQKTTLTFDAVPDVSIAGTVSEVDPLGAASQGVVNYTVKIAFDTQDERVKPGMSVSAAIVTDVATDVLAVPNAAIKRQGTQSSVQVLKNANVSSANDGSVTGDVETVAVEVGLSNDQLIEIKGGLAENVQVVTRTIDPNVATKTSATNAASGLRIPGVTGGATFGGNAGFGGGANFTRPAGR